MAIPNPERARIAQRLTEYCAPHPSPEVRRQLRHGFEIRLHDVILFEERPRFDRPRNWLRQDVARFRWFRSRREWQLYCQFRDLKWHLYDPRPSAKKFDTLLAEVDADPTGIFWG